MGAASMMRGAALMNKFQTKDALVTRFVILEHVPATCCYSYLVLVVLYKRRSIFSKIVCYSLVKNFYCVWAKVKRIAI